jgi:hypothetical protein
VIEQAVVRRRQDVSLSESRAQDRLYGGERVIQHGHAGSDHRLLPLVLDRAPAREVTRDILRRRIGDPLNGCLGYVRGLDPEATTDAVVPDRRVERLEEPRGTIHQSAGVVATVGGQIDPQCSQGLRVGLATGGDQHRGVPGHDERRGQASRMRAGEVPEMLRPHEEHGAESLILEMATKTDDATGQVRSGRGHR